MRTPEQVRQWAERRFAAQCKRWLDGAGEWPLSLSLERPKRAAVVRDIAAVKSWSSQWRSWIDARGPSDPQVTLEELTWPGLGAQTFVARVAFADAGTVARFAGESRAWDLACRRRDQLIGQWPQLAAAGLGSFYADLSTMAHADFERLVALMQWLDANPRSGLYVRQLPVFGVDTKWVDRARRGLVTRLVLRMRGVVVAQGDEDVPTVPGECSKGLNEGGIVDAQERQPSVDGAPSLQLAGSGNSTLGFHAVCGLRAAPTRIRLVVLCPLLRGQLGGLRDVEAPIEEVARLPLKPRAALIVENLETAHSLEDFEGGVAIARLGNAVGLLKDLPWLHGIPVLYWGDLDTYGFSILALARTVLESVGCRVDAAMMDLATIERHMQLAVVEPIQAAGVVRQRLTEAEWAAYESLLAQRWGVNVRIEQERIPWNFAVKVLQHWCSQVPTQGESILRPEPDL